MAITSAGTDGRPRFEGNKSANSQSGNSAARCSAQERMNRPVPKQVLTRVVVRCHPQPRARRGSTTRDPAQRLPV